MNVDKPSHGMLLSKPLCSVKVLEVAFFLLATSLHQLPWFFGSSRCQGEALAQRRYIHLHPSLENDQCTGHNQLEMSMVYYALFPLVCDQLQSPALRITKRSDKTH
uniref:Uncharacterized protein n=1 Tax=Opuntia streptacantha TaxID=393608 RepID=A0A7C8YW38_OPUST